MIGGMVCAPAATRGSVALGKLTAGRGRGGLPMGHRGGREQAGRVDLSSKGAC